MPEALVLDKKDDTLTAVVRDVPDDALPAGALLVSVLYSSLNYKDGLAVTGKGKIIRGAYPFIPGIDLVGRVEASDDERFRPGDLVVQTGGGLGETTWGGYSRRQRIPAEWVVPLPEHLAPLDAMTAGTAGFTAMLAVLRLEHEGLSPEAGEVLVTGASGGLGSFAVAILGYLGYTVVAATGSVDAHGYLHDLGAARIVDRTAFAGGAQRPLESAQWAGAVDAVGGETLAAVIAQMNRHGSIAVCGNAGGAELHTTVFPFILRGVNLLGIDSNTATPEQRRAVWQRLADLPESVFAQIRAGVVGLGQIPAKSEQIVKGGIRGRVVVDVNA